MKKILFGLLCISSTIVQASWWGELSKGERAGIIGGTTAVITAAGTRRLGAVYLCGTSPSSVVTALPASVQQSLFSRFILLCGLLFDPVIGQLPAPDFSAARADDTNTELRHPAQ